MLTLVFIFFIDLKSVLFCAVSHFLFYYSAPDRGLSIVMSASVCLSICLFACLSTNISLELHTDTHPFNGSLSGTTRVGRYQKGKTNLDFTEARDSEWQWHQLGYMHICTSLQTDNHASTPPLSFLRAGCPSCRPSVKALELPI